jgi:hypothetical protein
MAIRILSSQEISSIGQRVDFSTAAESCVTTMDMQDIDPLLSAARDAASQANSPAWPFFEHRGVLKHPPVPVDLRPYYPERERDGYDQPARFDIRGIDVDGLAILIFLPAADPHGTPQIWGADAASTEMIFSRGLPIQAVEQITDADDLRRSVADHEASRLAEAALPAPPARSPRI